MKTHRPRLLPSGGPPSRAFASRPMSSCWRSVDTCALACRTATLGRLRWLHRLPLGVCWHATASTIPRVPRAGQTARPDNPRRAGHDRGKRQLRRQPHRPARGPLHRSTHPGGSGTAATRSPPRCGQCRSRPTGPLGSCPTPAWWWCRSWPSTRPGPLGQGRRRRGAGRASPAPTKHASPAPGGARARTGHRRGQSGPNPLPSCRLTPAPTAATDRTLTVIVLGELATGGAATGWVGPRTGSASSEAGSAAVSVSRLPTLDRYRLGQDQRRPEPASRSRHELEQVVWVSASTWPRTSRSRLRLSVRGRGRLRVGQRRCHPARQAGALRWLCWARSSTSRRLAAHWWLALG